jgi:hypothetical protein
MCEPAMGVLLVWDLGSRSVPSGALHTEDPQLQIPRRPGLPPVFVPSVGLAMLQSSGLLVLIRTGQVFGRAAGAVGALIPTTRSPSARS